MPMTRQSGNHRLIYLDPSSLDDRLDIHSHTNGGTRITRCSYRMVHTIVAIQYIITNQFFPLLVGRDGLATLNGFQSHIVIVVIAIGFLDVPGDGTAQDGTDDRADFAAGVVVPHRVTNCATNYRSQETRSAGAVMVTTVGTDHFLFPALTCGNGGFHHAINWLGFDDTASW